MEKHHKTIAAVGEFEVPEEIVQNIQSFMREREAARTTLVSKSWYGAWSTRPNLSFDQYELRNRLPQFATKTLQRYEDLNLKIQTFSLRMYKDGPLARELILKAIKLGAIDLMIHVPTPSFVLPDEVLESQTLTGLSVSGCTVDLGRRKKEVITCSNLKSLNLSCVTVNGDFFKDLSWRFPAIEELTLKQPKSSPGQRLALDVGAMMKMHKLKYLRLECLDIKDSLSKHDLWPQFPCLKELVVQNFEFSKWNDVRICSPSLERIIILLYEYRNVNAEFDVPNIRYLKLKCDGFPRLKLETTKMSREWVSDIHISCRDYKASNLCMLKQVVSRVSRVSLDIDMVGYNWADDGEGYVGDGLELGVPALENLTLQNIRVTSAFLDDILRTCRPNFIYIERAWLGNVEALQQLRPLPWKTNTFSLNPPHFLRFQPKYFNDLQELFVIREGTTFSDAEYVRFELR